MTKNSNRERRFRRLLTYHEAGHAVAARLLGIEIADVDMSKTEEYIANVKTRSATHQAEQSGDRDAIKVGLYADLQVALAGDVAQQLAGYPASTLELHEADADMANAGTYAGMLARLDAGLSAMPGPTDLREIKPGDLLHTAISDILDRGWADTVALLQANWLAVVRVAAALNKPNLKPSDIDRIIAHGQRS